jgi:hypothetical protein
VVPRDESDCHCRKTATEYDRKPGIKWLRCTAKRQCDRALVVPRCGGEGQDEGQSREMIGRPGLPDGVERKDR